MSNFNYCNYIGEHMSEPLMVMNTKGNIEYLFAVTAWNIQLDNTPEFTGITFDHDFEDCKPLIKSISDLTDEELIWVALHDKKLDAPTEVIKNRLFLGVQTGDCDITVLRNFDNVWKLTQQQFNRLYSLHVSLDYDELIRTGKAVREG